MIGSVGSSPAISRDGSTIISDAIGSDGVTSAAIWMGGTNWKTLGGIPGGVSIDGTISSGYSVSADGSAIVGLAWLPKSVAHGFRWDASNGMVDLGDLQSTDSRANAISADGNMVAGWDANPGGGGSLGQYNYWRGVIWWQGLERLLNPFGWVGQVQALNNDGSVIVGRGSPLAPRHAYRFTAWDGRFTDLGAIKRGILPDTQELEDTSIAFAVSDDGTVVIGNSGYQPPLDAFLYNDVVGIVKLSDYLTSKGVVIPKGWTLVSALAITPDGKTIAGTGINPSNALEGFVATVF